MRKLPLKDVRDPVALRAKAMENLRYAVAGPAFAKAYERADAAEAQRIARLIDEQPFAESTLKELKAWIARQTPKPETTYGTMTVRQLRHAASAYGIRGFSRMSQSKLIEALERRTAGL